MSSMMTTQNQEKAHPSNSPISDFIADNLLRLVGIGLLLAVLSSILLQEHGDVPVGTQAPMLRVVTLDGDHVQFPPDGKPRFINFWATWCGPCVGELPAINRVAQRWQGKVQFAGVAAESVPVDVAELADRKKLTYPIYVIPDAEVHEWGVSAFPTNFLLDGEGHVLWTDAGAMSEASLEKLLREKLPHIDAP